MKESCYYALALLSRDRVNEENEEDYLFAVAYHYKYLDFKLEQQRRQQRQQLQQQQKEVSIL